jgi:RHS repeat-associated protein
MSHSVATGFNLMRLRLINPINNRWLTFAPLLCSFICFNGSVHASSLDNYHNTCNRLLQTTVSLEQSIDVCISAYDKGRKLSLTDIQQLELDVIRLNTSVVDFSEAIESLDQDLRDRGVRAAAWTTTRTHLLSSIEKMACSGLDTKLFRSFEIVNGDIRLVSVKSLEDIKSQLSAFIHAGVTQTGTKHLPFKQKALQSASSVRADKRDRYLTVGQFRDKLTSFSHLQSGDLNPSDYIESGHELILEKAADLAWDPLGIFNYVRNSVHRDPYPGFRKRPSSLVDGGSANAWDTAALLVSLLRASGIDCRFAHGPVDIPIASALAWLGYHYPEDEDPEIITAKANEMTAYLNSIYPSEGDNPFAYAVIEGDDEVPSWIHLADHAFVLTKIDYVPSRGAQRSGCEPENLQKDCYQTVLPPYQPTKVDPPPDYNGDTWIPLDPCMIAMETHAAVLDNPLESIPLSGPESILQTEFLSSVCVDDPVELLLDRYFEVLPDPAKGEPSPLFLCSPGAKHRYEILDYLPNTLPYRISEAFEIVSDESAFIDFGNRLPRVVVSVSSVPYPGFDPYALVTGPTHRSFELAELVAKRLTFRFVPDDLQYWQQILEDNTFRHMYEVPGLIVRPQLVLDGVFDENGDGVDDWDSGYPDSVANGSDYWVYFSVQDTWGNWYSSENKIPAGEIFNIAVATATSDSTTDLQLVDTMNTQLLSEGEAVPKLYEKQFNEEFLGRYLQLQGRHYFKQLRYSEDVLSGMFRGRMIRDSGIARIGMTFGRIIYLGGDVASVSGAVSFCDVDHYLAGAQLENPSLNQDFWTYLGYTASAGEHELFFRETLDHKALVSAARIFQHAVSESDVIYHMNGQTSPPYHDVFQPSMFTDPAGYPGFSVILAQQLNQHIQNGYTVEVPCSCYRFERVSGSSNTSWTGTGYRLTNGTSSAFMIYGVLDDAPACCAREMGGAMGLTGQVFYFDDVFDLEFEAFVMQQTNLTKSQKYPVFRYQWEDEYQHWITLGVAKEFRWRFRTYSFKTHHYRILCASANCVEGRPWVKVLIWDGQGSMDAVPDYLVAVFRSDEEIECINLYNKEYDSRFENPWFPRPEPRQALEPETTIKWFDYDPWRPGTGLPSNLPSWNWDVGLPNFSYTMWMGAFIGSNTASSTLFHTINPRVWHQVGTPESTCTETPTASSTPYPTISPTPEQKSRYVRNSPVPTATPTRTATVPVTPTPTPAPPTVMPGGTNHCDGFLAAKDNPLMFPSEGTYLNKWSFARKITRQYTSIDQAAMEAIPTCHPRNWGSSGFEPHLGRQLFGDDYRNDDTFLNWHFDVYHPGTGPGCSIDLHDSTENCPHYFLEGFTTHCLDENTPQPTPQGRCPLPGTLVKVHHKDVPDPGVEYTYLGEVSSEMVPVPGDPDYSYAYFLFDTMGQHGYFRIEPYKIDAEGRITHALPWSDLPDEPGTIDGIYIPPESWGDPVKVTETGNVGLESFPENCLDPPNDDAYLGNDAFSPAHFRNDGICGRHPFFPVRGFERIDLFSGKLHFSMPLLSRPGDGGNALNMILTCTSSIYPFASEGPCQTWVKEGWVGTGWDLHMGKVVVQKGELPVIYGPDGSSRTAFCENDEYNLGPYRSEDLWSLQFSGGVNLHDDEVVAEFRTDTGWKYICNEKIENSSGLCPFGDCDNYVYTWLVTQIIPPDDTVPLTTITYDTYSDMYGRIRTSPDETYDLIRFLWSIETVQHRFGLNGFTVTFDCTEFTDDPAQFDLPKTLTQVYVNSVPHAQFTYNEDFEFHLLMNSLKFLSGYESDPVWQFDYYPGYGPSDRFDRWRGVLKGVTSPYGSSAEYHYIERQFHSRLYSNSSEGYDSIELDDLAVSRITVTGDQPDFPFGEQTAVYTFDVPEYGSGTDFTRIQVFDVDPDVHVDPPVKEIRITFHHYETGASESLVGFPDSIEIWNGSSELVSRSETEYTFRTIADVPEHPCVDFVPETALISSRTDTEFNLTADDDSTGDKTVRTTVQYDNPGGDPVEYYYTNASQIETSEQIGLSDWKCLSKTQFDNTAISEPSFQAANILRLPEKVRKFTSESEFTELSYIYDTLTHSGRISSTSVNGTLTVTYQYDGYGNINEILPPTDHPVHLQWWQTGGEHDLVISKGSISTGIDFDGQSGLPVLYECENGHVTTLQYDTAKRLRFFQSPDTHEIEIHYPNPNMVTMKQGPLQNRVVFDSLGQIKQVAWKSDQGAGGYNFSTTVRDALGRIQYAGLPSLTPELNFFDDGYLIEVYDLFGRATRIRDPASITMTADYVPGSAMITDGEGLERTYTYDGLGRLIQVKLPREGGLAGISTCDYDLAGHLIEVTQGDFQTGNKQIRSWIYDDFGRLIETIDPETGNTKITYDDDTGYIVCKTYGDLSVAETPPAYYDDLDRLTQQDFYSPDGQLLAQVQYVYDGQDVCDYGYDDLPDYYENATGRLTAIITSHRNDTEMERETVLTWPKSDSSGQLVEKTSWIRTEDEPVTSKVVFNYEEKLGRLARMSCFRDIDDPEPFGEIKYQYKDYLSDDAPALLDTITLSVPGQPDRVVGSGFIHHESGAFERFDLGNGVEESSQYDNAHKLSGKRSGQLIDFDYAYDNAGNVTGISAQTPRSSDLYAFEYDNWYRLSSAVMQIGDDTFENSYDMDEFGNIIHQARSVNGTTVFDHGYGFAPIRNIISFGGSDGTREKNDTQKWEESNWIVIPTDDAPSPRTDHAMVFDQTHQELILFGGQTDMTFSDETWVFDGKDWHRMFPGSLPAERAGHVLVYDSSQKRVLLFGGINQLGYCADIWEWDGSDWWLIESATGPLEREGFTLVFDSDRQCAVMFGGQDQSGLLSDTLIWDGSDWSSIAIGVPSARHDHAMVYDPDQKRVILFGGEDEGLFRNDTWILQNGVWTEDTSESPSARSCHAMTFDTDLGIVFMSGGIGDGQGNVLNDCWSYINGWVSEGSHEKMERTDHSVAYAGYVSSNTCGDFEYNDRGFRIEDSDFNYYYDGMGRLSRMESHDSKAAVSEYMYDGTGKRIMTKSGMDDVENRYLMYLGEVPVMEWSESGNPGINVYAGGQRLARIEIDEDRGDTEILYYHLDHLGSTVSMTDQAGEVIWPGSGIHRYHPYGEDVASSEGNPIRFTGKMQDESTGQYYFNARYLTNRADPDTGPPQFLTPDPVYGNVANPLSWNRYTYCNGNPVNFVDPDGRDAYAVYRKLNIPGLDKTWNLPDKPAGHVYLAFDDNNMGAEWRRVLGIYGYNQTSNPDPLDFHDYNDFITFSFHPWSVNKHGVGNRGSVIYTAGSWISINDLRSDIIPIRNGEVEIIRITDNEADQIKLFQAAEVSARANRANMESGDIGSYSFAVRNCGFWAKHIVESCGLAWPQGAMHTWNLGVGLSGDIDLTLPYLITKMGYHVCEGIRWSHDNYQSGPTVPYGATSSLRPQMMY